MSFAPLDYSQIQRQLKSEKENSFWGGYFKPGVYGSTPTQKKIFVGRILPAFNYHLSPADVDFAASWMPYRNTDNVDPETNQPVLSAFFAVVAAYSWFGNKQVSFLSPSTLRFTHSISRGPELIDPVQDIRNYAKKHTDPAIRALTERPENKKDAKIIIPYPQRRYVFNFYGAGPDRQTRNYLIDVSQKAFEDLAGKLSEWRPAHEQTIDHNWPNYLYGDITDPQTGIVVETTSIPSTPQPFNGFVFTTGSHKSLKGIRQQAVPDEALTGRYQLYGDNSAFKIMSAQEIVDFLVEDGAIPYHLIEEVCSNYAHVPARPNKATVFPGSADEEDNMDNFQPPVANPMAMRKPISVPPAPPAPVVQEPAWAKPAAPPPPAPTPPPPPAPPEERYWVSMNGGMDDDTYSRSEVQSLISRNLDKNFMLCNVEPNSPWQSPVELGFVMQASKPKSPPPPHVGLPPALPTMPSSAPPAVAVKAAPAASALTPEEMQDYMSMKSSFDAGTLSPVDLVRMMKLVGRLEASA